jgi:hypothetical protein
MMLILLLPLLVLIEVNVPVRRIVAFIAEHCAMGIPSSFSIISILPMYDYNKNLQALRSPRLQHLTELWTMVWVLVDTLVKRRD